MDDFLQQLFNGVVLGAVYGLIALGYTMVYGVLRFINFAHGDVFMLGAFAAWGAASALGGWMAPGWGLFLLSLLVAMGACALLGMGIEFAVYRPLRKRPRITVLITAIAVSLLIENAGQTEQVFGAAPRAFPDLLPAHEFDAAGIHSSSLQWIVLGSTVVLMFALRHFVLRTRLGTAMRAVSHSPDAAALMGVNIDRVISATFAVGSALAAAGGVFYAMNYPAIDPLMGVIPGLKAFVAAVLGGIGSIPGAALGGLVLGVVETFVAGSRTLSPYKDAVAFSTLILLLLFRPGGLLGTSAPEKV